MYEHWRLVLILRFNNHIHQELKEGTTSTVFTSVNFFTNCKISYNLEGNIL